MLSMTESIVMHCHQQAKVSLCSSRLLWLELPIAQS